MEKKGSDGSSLIAMQTRLDAAIGRVPILALDGANFQAWVVMLEYALTAAIGKGGALTNRNQYLSPAEDTIVKHGILAMVDELLQIGVIQEPTSEAAFAFLKN